MSLNSGLLLLIQQILIEHSRRDTNISGDTNKEQNGQKIFLLLDLTFWRERKSNAQYVRR